MTASDVAKPADRPATRPATVERICFKVEAFLVKAIGITSPAKAPPPVIKREVILLFLISSSEEFSVTNFLDLHPQMYTIAIKNENRCTIVQEIDLNSGKITCSMCIGETYRDQLGLAVVLLGEMEDVATKLFKQEIAELTISVPDFEEKTYLFEFTFSKIVYTPKTSINLKYFDSLKKYF